jgi:hypothetical protein
MAVERALVFRAGTRRPTCAAFEVAIEEGSRGQVGRMRGIRQCTNPATVIWMGTGLCVGCRDLIEQSDISVARDIGRR